MGVVAAESTHEGGDRCIVWVAIEVILRDLQKLRSNFSTFSIESRREIVTLEIVTFSLGRFLAGDSVSRVVKDCTILGRDLQGLGGSIEVAEYGPKVQAVFRGLL